MPEAMPENFSTTLVCLYFATAFERALELLQPRVWLAPNDPRPWKDLFKLDRNACVWMCRDLLRMLGDRDVTVTNEQRAQFGALKPDVWLQDTGHAIIIENKLGRRRGYQESRYLDFLREPALAPCTRGFLYTVPEGWTVNHEAEWWDFVGQGQDSIIRGIVKWDSEFVQQLCTVLKIPQWFHDKLPDRIGEQFL